MKVLDRIKAIDNDWVTISNDDIKWLKSTLKEALSVIEWYADEKNYLYGPEASVSEDKAREFLEKVNK